eukprot:738411-Amphidinium_carterae.1
MHLLLPGLRQSVYRAEPFTVVRALKECLPSLVIGECKGVVCSVQTLQAGSRQQKGVLCIPRSAGVRP